MDLYSRDADDLSDIKRAILNGYLNEDDDDESDGNETSDVEEFYEELKGHETKPAQNCDASPKEDDEEELGSALRIIFGEESLFPIPSNLVSAMKGSREKQGMLQKKLTVTWAADVYDPVPSIGTVQLARGMKQKKSKKNNNENNKKNGKKGQKGSNSSRGGGGGGGKDKKHLRRGGSSEQSDGVGDFEVGSPDPYCGSSFLKKSHTKMHYSVAEAL